MPAGRTYTPIYTNTLNIGTNSITFSSIPQTYTDLVLVSNLRVVTGAALRFYVNSDTGSNYSQTFLQANGTNANNASNVNQTRGSMVWTGTGKTQIFTSTLNFMNYSNTTTNKLMLVSTNAPNSEVTRIINLWRSTSAITSITIDAASSVNIDAGSMFTLYGILAA